MMEDKDLAKLMKQSTRRQTGKVVALSAVVILLVIGVGYLFYSHQYNYWPFDEGKVTGLPNQTLRRVDPLNRVEDLLLTDQDILEFNVKAQRAVITMAHYKKEKLVAEQELLALSAETSAPTSLGGIIQWGVMDGYDAEINLKVAIQIKDQSASADYLINPTDGGAGLGMASSGFSQEVSDVKLDQSYQIGFWGFGEDTVYSTDFFAEKEMTLDALKNNTDSFVLSVKFE